MKIIMIVPTYNEAANLPELFKKIFSANNQDLQVLVVDDNSPDGTGALAEQLSAQYGGRVLVLHRSGKNGLRTAYLDGMRKALELGADAIGQMDADLSHDPQRIPLMIAALKDSDAAFGSRYVAGGSLDDNWPLWRKVLSRFANFYARTILGMSLRDITSGFRLWRRETLLGMPLERIKANGYIFLVEMAYMADRLGFKIAQIPIHFADRHFGDSKMSFRIQLEAAIHVWKVRANFRDLKP